MKKIPTFLFALLSLFFSILLMGCNGSQSTTTFPTNVPAPAREEQTPAENQVVEEEPPTLPTAENSGEETGSMVPFEPIAGDNAPVEGCTAMTILPQADPTTASLFPLVNAEDWARGPSGAAVTIVEYSDFQCVACAQLALVLNLLQQEFPNDLRVVYRHFPQLNTNNKAELAMQASEAAGQQGKFWEMHDLLFLRQQEWAGLSEEDFHTWLNDRLPELGLNVNQYAGAMFGAGMTQLSRQAYAEAVEIGIPGTPFLLINGRIYDGPADYVSLSVVIKLYALQNRQFTQCPPMIIDPDGEYIATIQTEKGNIVVELFADKAPITVNNFVFLATNGWYDNVTFHRVLKESFIAQAGDPSGTGYGGPGYTFINETSELTFDLGGVLAMANAGPDTNGSQFFITLGPTPQYNGAYTIFGQVIEGMDIVNSLTDRDPSQSLNLPPGDQIITVTIDQK